jgi:hypothetical protein
MAAGVDATNGLPDNASNDASYFFLPEAKVDCHAEAFWLGTAAITLISSFFRLLGLPIPSLLAVSHVDLLRFEDDTGIRSKPG